MCDRGRPPGAPQLLGVSQRGWSGRTDFAELVVQKWELAPCCRRTSLQVHPISRECDAGLVAEHGHSTRSSGDLSEKRRIGVVAHIIGFAYQIQRRTAAND
jgi:hypothetical protein